jgi:hypothetical protein
MWTFISPSTFLVYFRSQLRKMQRNRHCGWEPCLFRVNRNLSLAFPFYWLATLHFTSSFNQCGCGQNKLLFWRKRSRLGDKYTVMVSNRRPFSFSFIFGNRKKSQGAKSGGTMGGWWQPFYISPKTAGWVRKCETGRCHGEAVRSVLAKVRGVVFARFHAVAAKLRSRTRNPHFGVLGPVIRATTTTV